MQFDPFEKELGSVTATDLERLRSVNEGWYVEYKRDPINAKDTGKSLSAFANHYGGWLIFGVDAKNAVPTAFPGLDSTQAKLVGEALRAAAQHHVNPTVSFETHEVSGPLDTIGLPANRSVILVRIRSGTNPPYIHSSGRIYRRVADSSDPKHETDRAVIDLLVERSREARLSFRKRIKRRPEFSRGEEELPVLQIFLTTDPWREREIKNVLEHNEFAEIMGRRDDAAFAMDFDNTFPTANGFVARHVYGNDPFAMVTTWQFSHSGFSSVVFGIRAVDSRAREGYKHAAEFFALVPEGLRERVIDANLLWVNLACAVSKQRVLSDAIGLGSDSLYVKFRYLNVWRRVPYLDTPEFIAHVKARGVPVVQHSSQFAPTGLTPYDMIELKASLDSKIEPPWMPLLVAGQALHWLFGAIGAPYSAIASTQEMIATFQRAVGVHKGDHEAAPEKG